jgi:hypothetical protein
MFSEYSIDMADLFQAYGGMDDNYSSPNYFEEPQPEQPAPPPPKPKIKENFQMSPPVQQAVVQQQAPRLKEGFQNMDLQEYYQPPVQVPKQRNPSYSFWDRMSMKRPEVVKLAAFGLVIVLAISLERIGTHYLTRYLADNMLTDFQEFMLRFSYPIMVFLLLWIIKSL